MCTHTVCSALHHDTNRMYAYDCIRVPRVNYSHVCMCHMIVYSRHRGLMYMYYVYINMIHVACDTCMLRVVSSQSMWDVYTRYGVMVRL